MLIAPVAGLGLKRVYSRSLILDFRPQLRPQLRSNIDSLATRGQQ